MPQDSPPQDALRPPHPLALALIERLKDRESAPILEVGRGSGRNTRALEAAGFAVIGLEDGSGTLGAGALSTHALLHGADDDIATLLQAIAVRLEPGAPLFCTFGSVRDARFGRGSKSAPHTFALPDGDEAGIAHTFFDAERLRQLLGTTWIVESLEEHDVDGIAGDWAHVQTPLNRSVHFFAQLRRSR
ncbi:MAG: hypothetical protein M3N13_07800 [Candidatus Eremiobacteraeota bacterium]|nr:hypothetical protein [Candidatus Eremiobacteraeota bacterium]